MSKEESGKAKRSAEEPANALAARRARLRSSLAPQTGPQNTVPQNTTVSLPTNVKGNAAEPEIHALSDSDSLSTQPPTDTQALKLLGNIDQALNSCASHLASLQKVANKQIDELKVIADTLQHQPGSEVGLNINTLMESLTAAIEPMKAISELVPALDRLVSVSTLHNEPAISQLNEKELVLSLAEQLAAGKIEASTFKAAFQATFSDYDLNGQLHQLSELLGQQQLSGELFQIAFAALQSTESTAPAFLPNPNDLIPMPAVNWENDTETITESEQSQAQPLISEREIELEKQLADKERELEEFKEQLDQRWQQLNGAYEELRTTLENRENILQSKEDELSEKIAELAAKDSENKQLRTQMEELRDQTKEMVTDLQKQLAQKHAEEKAMRTAKTKTAATQPGFFELFSAQPHSAIEQKDVDNAMTESSEEQKQTITNATPTTNTQTINTQPINPQAINPQAINHQAVNSQNVNSQTLNSAIVSNQASADNVGSTPAAPHSGFASPTSSFVSTAGSYGSGVRAQVFEVIVRQALAGAHWREICAVPMQINNISPEEVESEVKRRQALLKK